MTRVVLDVPCCHLMKLLKGFFSLIHVLVSGGKARLCMRACVCMFVCMFVCACLSTH